MTRALKFGCVAAIVLVTGGWQVPWEGGIKLGPVDTGPNTVEAARKYLEGRWTMISYEVRPPGRPPIELKGKGMGSLTYDSYGNLDMQIRVKDPAVSERLAEAGVPLKEGVIASAGRVAIDIQKRTITYILKGQSPLISTAPAGPLATSRPRHWQVEGPILTLTTKGDDGNPVSVGRWQKQ